MNKAAHRFLKLPFAAMSRVFSPCLQGFASAKIRHFLINISRFTGRKSKDTSTLSRVPIIQKNNEIQQEIEKLKKENARLKAALSESEFECQRLVIINSNLETQLNVANRELGKNIQVLQSLKGEIEELVDNLKNTKQ